MSTNSKFNPISLAIKKKLDCRLGLTKKRYLPLVQKPIDHSNWNCEWSVSPAALSKLDPGQDVSNDVHFSNIEKWNHEVWNIGKGRNANSQQGDLFKSQRNGNHWPSSEFLQYLTFALGHSPMRISEYYLAMSKSTRPSATSTMSKYLENLEKVQEYVRKLTPLDAIEEDDL